MKTRIVTLVFAFALSLAPVYGADSATSCDMSKGGCCKAAECCTKDAACCKDGASCCTAGCDKDKACKHADAKDACAKACGNSCKKAKS